MAKNDAILLDGIISDRIASESRDRGEAFEIFAFEQILKSYDLTRQELDYGWVDGKDDGGIDGLYTFVNGSLVQDPAKFSWPRKGASIDIFVINCKHADSFRQDPLNTLFPTIEELLDFEKGPEDFNGEYSVELLRAREVAVQAFRRTASGLPKLNFRFIYASRGDIKDLATNVASRGNQLKRIVADYFSDADVQLDYFGAAELISLHRKTRFVLELPYAEQLSSDPGAYILLVRLRAYADFVSDDQRNLRRYLFDSNVRDFLVESTVNQDITQTLTDNLSPDFWWLNNGVTILATSAIPLGKTSAGNALQLHDVQIVNGLQTTQTIHHYFSSSINATREGCVLVKVIVSEDTAIRDSIIRATNNQNSVEMAALNATDKIQRDIEAILERHDWFYERRRNYYKNIGKPTEKFINPLYLSVSMVALVRKAPHQSSRLQNRFMLDSESYQAVFSERIPILVWPKLATIMKLIDSAIAEKAPKHKLGRRMIAGWRGAVALCAVSEILGSFDYSIEELIGLDIQLISRNRIIEIFEFLLLRAVTSSELTPGSNIQEGTQVGRADIQSFRFGESNKILGVEVIGRWRLPTSVLPPSIRKSLSKSPSFHLPHEIIEKVFNHLLPQPWPRGMQNTVAYDTGLELATVRKAIKHLIGLGRFRQQVDGVVIDLNGLIVDIDKARADVRYKVGERFTRIPSLIVQRPPLAND